MRAKGLQIAVTVVLTLLVMGAVLSIGARWPH